MSVRLGKDGTVYCTTVRYNYKQTKNLVADSSFSRGYWIFTNSATIRWNTLEANNLSMYGLWNRPNLSTMCSQPVNTPIANHKYYGAIYWQSPSGFTCTDACFQFYLNDNQNFNTKLTFANVSNVSTNGAWVKYSRIVTCGSSPVSGSWIARCFVVNGSASTYYSRPIVIDLTETFGAGNEPTKEWCDENIIEWSMLNGIGSEYSESFVKTGITFEGWASASMRNIAEVFAGTNTNKPSIPRTYFMDLQSSASNVEAYIYPDMDYLTEGEPEYRSIEVNASDSNLSWDWYFPIAEPLLGTATYNPAKNYNGGGQCSGWKRISFYGYRNQFTPNKHYENRIDFNNKNANIWLWATNILSISAAVLKRHYDNFYGTNISLDVVNKEFCDRFYNGFDDSIIHIKDHTKTSIKFNRDYDIICNDIRVKPEMGNEIVLDKTGTITCKRLVKVAGF